MNMSQTISLRLPDELVIRLDRFARRLGNGTTRSRASQIILDEAMREEEFTGIEFRNSSVGRLPYVRHTGMAVWEFIMVAKDFDMDAAKTTAHLQVAADAVSTALNYYDEYREEIDLALLDNSYGEARMKRIFPNMRVFEVPLVSDEPDP